MKNINLKKVAMRIFVTFIEAGAGYLVVADGFDNAALAGAVGAGLSVVWNTVLLPLINEHK